MLARIRAVSSAARETGSLVPIETESQIISYKSRNGTSGGVLDLSFLLRRVVNLARKDNTASASAVKHGAPIDPAGGVLASKPTDWNPFLPYDAAMYVQHVAPAHVMLLNKFNVVHDHTLIVTETFEEQSSLLTTSDFEALWRVLGEVDGLGFYNAGRTAGASQRHKHLQVVPAPLIPGSDIRTPFDRAFAENMGKNDSEGSDKKPWMSPHLPFLHMIVSVRDCCVISPSGAGIRAMERYMDVLHRVQAEVDNLIRTAKVSYDWGDGNGKADREGHQPFPYNLLVTRDYMVIIPRRNEFYTGDFEGKISVNSLGFVGCLLVRDDAQLEVVAKAPMDVLKATAFPVPELQFQ